MGQGCKLEIQSFKKRNFFSNQKRGSLHPYPQSVIIVAGRGGRGGRGGEGDHLLRVKSVHDVWVSAAP